MIPISRTKWFKYFLSVSVLTISVLVVCSAVATAQTPRDQFAASLTNAGTELQRYYASRVLNDETSLTHLKVTIDTLFRADDYVVNNPQETVKRRRIIVAAWVQILKAIEDSYDPNFNLKNFW